MYTYSDIVHLNIDIIIYVHMSIIRISIHPYDIYERHWCLELVNNYDIYGNKHN